MGQEVLGLKPPAKDCRDQKCPFHGQIKVKRGLFRGKVVRKDVHHSATIEWFIPRYIAKYERYAMRRSRLRVHNPPCLDAPLGAEVLAARTRPLSKTKNHVIIKIVHTGKVVVKGIIAEEEKKRQREEKVSEAQK